MKRRLKTIVLVAVVIYLIWKFLSGLIGGVAASGPDHFTDRLWLERLPKNERDMVHAMLFVEIRKHRFGAQIYGSAYRRTFDLLEWSVEGKDLTVLLKQDEVTKKYSVRTWNCKSEAPAPFDLCMELRSGLKSERFYSRKDWGRSDKDAYYSIEELQPFLESAAPR